MNTQIHDEAAQWLVEFQTEDTDTRMRERFCAWLDTSPEHVRAYLEVSSLWEEASDIDKRRALDVDALTASARAERNLFPLEAASARQRLRGPWSQLPSGRRRAQWAVAASLAVLGIGVAAVAYWNSHLRGVYSTGIAEQRTLALADGTTVELNAGTRIRERFTNAERAVELLQGQALFRVARNTARPFIVRGDTVTVRAIGTQFDVHRRATGMTVTVLEGRVAVMPAVTGNGMPSMKAGEEKKAMRAMTTPASASSSKGTGSSPWGGIVLDAGEQLNLHHGEGSAAPSRADIGLATAWTQQRLAFEFTNLSDAAEEFNRFNVRKLVVNPRGLEDFKVSGTFQALDAGSLERFVRFLREQPGLSVVESGDRIVVEKNR